MTARRHSSCAVFLRPGLMLTGLLAAIALAEWTAPAHAAGPDEAAQQAFRTGVEAARQERWTDALAAFEKAYGLSPRPVVLINLAGVQVRTGRLIEAAKNYHRILSDRPSAETTAFRKAAADVLPSLEARIPRIRLRSQASRRRTSSRSTGNRSATQRSAPSAPSIQASTRSSSRATAPNARACSSPWPNPSGATSRCPCPRRPPARPQPRPASPGSRSHRRATPGPTSLDRNDTGGPRPGPGS